MKFLYGIEVNLLHSVYANVCPRSAVPVETYTVHQCPLNISYMYLFPSVNHQIDLVTFHSLGLRPSRQKVFATRGHRS